MIRSRKPARFTGLIQGRASWKNAHPESGELPAAIALYFRKASGPAILSDGRMLVASITPAELATIIGALPALTLEDDEDARALFRVAQMLRGEKHQPPSEQED